MLETTNYRLKKIELTDSPPDITVINPNWDIIDTEFKAHEGHINTLINKGYVNAKDIGIIDFNTLTTQGKYITNYGQHANGPVEGSQMFTINITGLSSYLSQEVINLSGSKYIRFYNNGVWSNWNKIVTSKQPDWITATLQNSWVAYGSPYYDEVSYYKDSFGIVRLKGVVKNGLTNINTVILQLPIGYRPTRHLAFACYSGEISKVQVSSTGQILFISGTNSALSLDGITFRAEQ